MENIGLDYRATRTIEKPTAVGTFILVDVVIFDYWATGVIIQSASVSVIKIRRRIISGEGVVLDNRAAGVVVKPATHRTCIRQDLRGTDHRRGSLDIDARIGAVLHFRIQHLDTVTGDINHAIVASTIF